MTQIRKVPFSAGAEWLLGGFSLWRRAPLALGLLGLIWGCIAGLASVTGQLWLSLVLALLGPVLFAGVVYAAREVDQGRKAEPAHLLQGLRDGKGPRLMAMLVSGFAGLAAFVAAIGLYGVLAYVVSLRTREIGVRLALGASSGRVIRGIVRQGLVLAAVGLAAGLAGAVAGSHLIAAQLYEVSPTDGWTFVSVAVGLGAVAVLASFVPARRAASVDPLVALRE